MNTTNLNSSVIIFDLVLLQHNILILLYCIVSFCWKHQARLENPLPNHVWRQTGFPASGDHLLSLLKTQHLEILERFNGLHESLQILTRMSFHDRQSHSPQHAGVACSAKKMWLGFEKTTVDGGGSCLEEGLEEYPP